MIGDDFSQVLADAKRRSERAFSALYRDLAPALLGFVRGQGISDPEDTLAEIMISVARSIGSFTGDETAFRSWVFTIAYRRVADSRRRRFRRAAEVPLDDVASVRSGTSIDAEELSDIEYGPLATALTSLKPNQRDVVLLRVVAGLPLSEVAAIVGKSETAVKMIQVRALQRLRELIPPDVAVGQLATDSEKR